MTFREKCEYVLWTSSSTKFIAFPFRVPKTSSIFALISLIFTSNLDKSSVYANRVGCLNDSHVCCLLATRFSTFSSHSSNTSSSFPGGKGVSLRVLLCKRLCMSLRFFHISFCIVLDRLWSCCSMMGIFGNCEPSTALVHTQYALIKFGTCNLSSEELVINLTHSHKTAPTGRPNYLDKGRSNNSGNTGMMLT